MGFLLRVYLLTIGGVTVCTGIVVFALGFTAYELLAKEPFAPRSDLLETWIFGALASVVLLISLRAWRRIRRGEDGGDRFALLARLVPLLMLLGAGGGVWATLGIIGSAERTQRMLEESLCSEVGATQLDACVPEAHRCDKLRAAFKPEGGWHPDFAQRPEVSCLRQAGRAAGWLK
jgi:hypothetical protein